MTGAAQAMLSASGSGAAPARVSVSNQSLSNTVTTGYQLGTDGNATKTGSSSALLEAWLLLGAAADYQVRTTFVSGDALTSGTLNTWKSLATAQQWVLSSFNHRSCTIFVEIRDAVSLTVLDSAFVDLATG